MSKQLITQNSVITDSDGTRWVQDHFIYVADISTLAPSSSQQAVINIEADSSFIWVKSSFWASTDLTANQQESTSIVPQVLISINDSGSGRNLQNKPVPFNDVAGREGLPLVLPIPREFKASSSISVTMQNINTAITYQRIIMSLIGFKKFRQQA